MIYFDDADTSDEERKQRGDLLDRRPLSPSAPSSVIRRDPVQDEWVTIAGQRQARTYLPADEDCPLCPSSEEHSSEIPAHDYDVVVFQNRFPSFSSVSTSGGGSPRARPSLHEERPGSGRCEVMCFTSDHSGAFSSLPSGRVRTVIEAWTDRTLALSQTPGVEQVFCFENRGEEIGVTLRHPHGQIYGYPFITPRTSAMIDSARAYQARTGGDLFADVLAAEKAEEERIIRRGNSWTAFVPFAARWPLEVHLYPNRHISGLQELDESERAELSSMYPGVLRAMESLYPDPLPYIAAWYQAPVRTGRGLLRLHLEVFSIRRAPGKLKYLAGSESAMGAFVNDVSPEESAQMLREAAP